MKNSGDALNKFQDMEETRKMKLMTGIIRLTPEGDVYADGLMRQACIQGDRIILKKTFKSGSKVPSSKPVPRQASQK